MKLKFKERTSMLQVGKITIDDQSFTKEEIKKMIAIVTDLAETNSFELPYRGEDLISRAIALVKQSKR